MLIVFALFIAFMRNGDLHLRMCGRAREGSVKREAVGARERPLPIFLKQPYK
jgi:hypothetical protein